MRVHINGASHQVELEVEHTDPSYVIDLARRLWEDTRQPEPSPGPASGFQIVERAQ